MSSQVRPSPCCRAAALAAGKAEGSVLCHSCDDYRVFLRTRYKDEVYRPPAGFQHATYKSLKGGKGKAE